MLTFTSSNILLDPADALVNPVNTVGVMGAGLAQQFKDTFPAMFTAYAAACRAGEVEVGRMHVYDRGRLPQRWIINFPTKIHWRGNSLMGYIDAGLIDLVEHVHALRLTSLAVPALGCGYGGLNWKDVRPRLIHAFTPLEHVDVRIYQPA